MNKEISRRVFSKRLALALAGLILFGNEGLASAEEEKDWSWVKKRENDHLYTLMGYYGVPFWKSALVREKNGIGANNIITGQDLLLPVAEERIKIPIRKIEIPAINYSNWTTTDYQDWQFSDQLGKYDLIFLDETRPYVLFIHSLPDNPNTGPASGLRQLKPKDKVWLSRTGDGRPGDWMKGIVKEVIVAKTEEEESGYWFSANSREIKIVTCRTETKENEDDRIIIKVGIERYFSSLTFP